MKWKLTILGLLCAANVIAASEPGLFLTAVWNSPTSSVADKAAALGAFLKTNETTYADLRSVVGEARVYSRAYGIEDRFSPPGGFTLLYEADYRFTNGTIWVRFIADAKKPKDEWRFHHLQVSTNRNPHNIMKNSINRSQQSGAGYSPPVDGRLKPDR